ncbi:uncharacterized protein LOC143732999 [Siphateles boraxobius]|uniref:uncharacterized protein LOC143732999 n=1 Tax=Siphateles boraxobius TaxID=180520 RepID=UPI00406492B6
MLLIIEALLLISAVLGQDHRTDVDEEPIFPLDMEEKSVDDLYVGCKKNMSDLVKTELLEKELNNSPTFKTVWQNGEENATIPNDSNLTWNHSVAIYVYTNSGFELYKDFNNAVRTDKQNYEDKTFTWYSLFFLLAEAIQILKEVQNVCKLTYRGTNVTFYNDVLNKEVRFGQFASSSLDRTEATLFGDKSCFEIKTCEGADVEKYSSFPEEEEVLIPPYEKFKVTDIKKRADNADLWCDTVYILESTGVRSDLNCAFFRNQAEISKTSAFNNNAFCRCVHLKLRTSHSTYRRSQSVQFLGKLGCFVNHQLRRHRVYPTDGDIHSDIHSWPYRLRGHRHNPTDGDIHSDIHSWPYPLRGHRHNPTDGDIHSDIHSWPYPLRGHRHNPTDGDIHSDIHSWPYPLRGHRHNPTDGDIHSDIHSWPYPLRGHRHNPTDRDIHSDIHSWPYPLRGHRHNPTDGDIHSDIHSWPYPLRGHRHNPTDGDIHSDIHSWPYPLRGHRHNPTDGDIHSADQINQRWLCYRFLHSLRINHNILALLRLAVESEIN